MLCEELNRELRRSQEIPPTTEDCVHLSGLARISPPPVIMPPGWCLAFCSPSICLLSAPCDGAAIRRSQRGGGGGFGPGLKSHTISILLSACMRKFPTQVERQLFLQSLGCMEHNQIQGKTLSADHTFEGVSLCENRRQRDKLIISGASSSSPSIYEFASDGQKCMSANLTCLDLRQTSTWQRVHRKHLTMAETNLLGVTFKAGQPDSFVASGASWQQLEAPYWCKGRHFTSVPAPWRAAMLGGV